MAQVLKVSLFDFAKTITLSDKQQDDIAYKVLALMEEWKLDEDKIVERVLEKFYSRLKG